jgi:hypothetical protein
LARSSRSPCSLRLPGADKQRRDSEMLTWWVPEADVISKVGDPLSFLNLMASRQTSSKGKVQVCSRLLQPIIT